MCSKDLVNHELSHNTVSVVLVIYPREIKMCGHTETCSQVFMTNLFVAA